MWAAVCVAFTAAVVLLQTPGRAPLTWDEAVRLRAAQELVFALSGGPGAVWTWFNEQTFYPFVAPLLHGFVLRITDDPIVSAWMPAVGGYAALGLLAAALVRELYPSPIAAWIAALLCWTTPLYARLASGGFVDTLGACASVASVWLLVRSMRTSRVRDAILAGVVIALAFFIRYDFGLLLVATLAAALVVFVVRGARSSIKPLVVAGVTAVVLIELWFIPDAADKWAGFNAFFRGSSGSTGLPMLRLDAWLYYPGALWNNPEVGLSGLIADAIVIAVLVAAVAVVRIPSLTLPVLSIAIWYVFYSVAGSRNPQFARYMASVLPFAFVLIGIGIARSIGPLQRSAAHNGALTSVAWLGAAVVGLELIRQVAGPTGFAQRFWFIGPNPAAEAVVEFLDANLGAEHSSLLLVGESNEVSPDLVRLGWMRQVGRPGQRVVTPDSGNADQTDLVLTVRATEGSRLDTRYYQEHVASQRQFMHGLETSPTHTRVARMSAEDGRLEVTLWGVQR